MSPSGAGCFNKPAIVVVVKDVKNMSVVALVDRTDLARRHRVP
jgi:hypothetical protein